MAKVIIVGRFDRFRGDQLWSPFMDEAQYLRSVRSEWIDTLLISEWYEKVDRSTNRRPLPAPQLRVRCRSGNKRTRRRGGEVFSHPP